MSGDNLCLIRPLYSSPYSLSDLGLEGIGEGECVPEEAVGNDAAEPVASQPPAISPPPLVTPSNAALICGFPEPGEPESVTREKRECTEIFEALLETAEGCGIPEPGESAVVTRIKIECAENAAGQPEAPSQTDFGANFGRLMAEQIALGSVPSSFYYFETIPEAMRDAVSAPTQSDDPTFLNQIFEDVADWQNQYCENPRPLYSIDIKPGIMHLRISRARQIEMGITDIWSGLGEAAAGAINGDRAAAQAGLQQALNGAALTLGTLFPW